MLPLSADLKAELQHGFHRHLNYSLGRSLDELSPEDAYISLSLSLRDLMMHRLIVKRHRIRHKKRVYYLSMEFLMGKMLKTALVNMNLSAIAAEMLGQYEIRLEDLYEIEPDAALGNGGLGRLAACYLDSLATLERPSIGYGIRYEFGIFDQEIHEGWQVEKTDNWLVRGNPWEIDKPDASYIVNWGGHTEQYEDLAGHHRVRWIPQQVIKGVSYDTPIQGYGVNTCNTLTLWSARSVESFALEAFNTGDFYKAVEEEVVAEKVSKVLYPNDEPDAGKRLRLQQQYFFVSCSLQDIVRIHTERAGLPCPPCRRSGRSNSTTPTPRSRWPS